MLNELRCSYLVLRCVTFSSILQLRDVTLLVSNPVLLLLYHRVANVRRYNSHFPQLVLANSSPSVTGECRSLHGDTSYVGEMGHCI
jgi:hypothetical protein